MSTTLSARISARRSFNDRPGMRLPLAPSRPMARIDSPIFSPVACGWWILHQYVYPLGGIAVIGGYLAASALGLML